MAEDDLKAFLLRQARSLDGLLSLTPAKNMFGEDVSDQWKRKKQTPEQKRAAKMAKLNPANWKSAKDVYDERSAAAAKKRKRDEDSEEKLHTSSSRLDSKHEAAQSDAQVSKKQKTESSESQTILERSDHDRSGLPESGELDNLNARKRAKKRANRAEKTRKRQERKMQKLLGKPKSETDDPDLSTRVIPPISEVPKGQKMKSKRDNEMQQPFRDQKNPTWQRKDQKSHQAGGEKIIEDELQNEVPVEHDSDASDVQSETSASTAPSLSDIPEILSPPLDSASSSVSSIPPNISEVIEKPASLPQSSFLPSKPATVPLQTNAEKQAARERLRQQISQLRSGRKADEKPIRSRAELLEQRRQEEQKRKAAKKEQRRKEKEDEARRQDEEMAKRFSPGGSGSLLASPRSPIVDHGDNGGFSFGRIAFGDGTQFDPSKLAAAEGRKHKGPSDPASALKAAQAKASRLSGLDEQKRKELAEKDMWLNAKKRAHGERVKDDTSLLKKALKRQEKQKNRSERDWDNRTEGVRVAQEARQKKRTENLQKRKDEKGSKKTGKKVKRPGFEGSFRGRTSNKTK